MTSVKSRVAVHVLKEKFQQLVSLAQGNTIESVFKGMCVGYCMAAEAIRDIP